MMVKKLILVRHADYENAGDDPGLSWIGEDQSKYLGINIAKELKDLGSVIIWSSTSKRASETAQIIKQEQQFAKVFELEKLWSDNWHKYDFEWLKEEIGKFEGEVLVIVSHLEYVREFPKFIGFNYNHSAYAEGVVITGEEIKSISHSIHN